MKLYSALFNGSPCGLVYTSIVGLCRDQSIPYSSVSKGKRILIAEKVIVQIYELELVKIKGRENNYKRKKNEET